MKSSNQKGKTDVGSRLRKRRQAKGFSVREAAERARTRKFFIKAIEENNFAVLPPKVYTRGIIERYCKILDLTGKKIWRDLEKETGFSGTFKKQDNFCASRNKFFSVDFLRIKKWLLLGVFAAIALFIAWRGEAIFGRPNLEIWHPEGDLVVSMDEFFVEGKTEGILKSFSVNGQAVNVAEDGTFREKIFLKPGENEIIFQATNLFDKKIEIKRKIINQEQ